ncbi:hypothetical protein [Salipaludibacillus daqingensis]|nr:hypothetical protein [Salipaludibacillus daqingensis]
MIIFALVAIFITIFSIEAKLRKSNSQNEEMIDLLKRIEEKL